MNQDNTLKRFTDAQQGDYAIALSEIKRGRKQSHWMWYIFPQIRGLGFSSTSQYYAIKDGQEAQDYLADPVLGSRLVEICKALLALESDDANAVLGSPDDMKLQSCMTLFASLPQTNPVFQLVLEKFFSGKKDTRTLQILHIKI